MSDGRGHGRIEKRIVKAVTVAAGLAFPHAAQAIQITRRTRRPGSRRWRAETSYAITSLPAEQARPGQLAAWIRGHWKIENQLHWVRDVTFGEDASTARTGTGPHVMAALRNLAISIAPGRSHPNRPRPPPRRTRPRPRVPPAHRPEVTVSNGTMQWPWPMVPAPGPSIGANTLSAPGP